MEIIISILALWCLYNTLVIKHNYRQDRRGDIIDKSTVKILQIHNKRLDRLEAKLDIKEPVKYQSVIFAIAAGGL